MMTGVIRDFAPHQRIFQQRVGHSRHADGCCVSSQIADCDSDINLSLKDSPPLPSACLSFAWYPASQSGSGYGTPLSAAPLGVSIRLFPNFTSFYQRRESRLLEGGFANKARCPLGANLPSWVRWFFPGMLVFRKDAHTVHGIRV